MQGVGWFCETPLPRLDNPQVPCGLEKKSYEAQESRKTAKLPHNLRL